VVLDSLRKDERHIPIALRNHLFRKILMLFDKLSSEEQKPIALFVCGT